MKKNTIITSFLFVTVIRICDKAHFMMVWWFDFTIRIFNSMNHRFVFFSGGYFDSEQAGTQVRGFTQKRCTYLPKEWSSFTDIAYVYTTGIHPFSHLKQHWYIGILLEWILKEFHDDVIKWKHFPRYWPFARRIHRSRWLPRTKASDAELWCILWSAPESMVE